MLLAMLWPGACGPRVAPEGPGTAPESTARTPAKPVQPATREMLVGAMCPEAAAGRPAVLPLFVRTLAWSADADDVSQPIERQRARQFSVLAWDGRRAGVLSVVGAADVGLDRKAAVGAYAGASPCARGGATPGMDTACVAALRHCGLALAALEPAGHMAFEEDPGPLPLDAGGACVAGDVLVVDIDGDGATEAYPISAFLDPSREPAEEVLAAAAAAPACTPTFARQGVLPAGDPRHWRGLDLLGVIDIDSDGRKELVFAYHYGESTTWAVYSATGTVSRLDLVGEAVPWIGR